MSFAVTASGVSLPSLPGDVRSVDICFGEDRVWSIDLHATPPPARGAYAWPAPLRPHLVGSTRVALRDSADGRELASVRAMFTDAGTETRVLDAEGVPLAINKWGRLGKTLEAGNPGVQQRILDRTEEVVAHLAGMDLRPFVVGGTLLGAVRDHALLPHDDDADVAYLSRHTNPADVAREGFEVGHRLEALGYELVRHSATHMQLYFRGAAGQLDHYVDVFSAFFTEDGRINQPFHVRGEMRENQMLPFSTVTIDGRDFPAPADTDRWLVINYDENWRTPIPGYRLETPRPTIRRFRNWFGSFHTDRDFWNEFHGGDAEAPERAWEPGAEWLLGQDLRSPALLDAGCGSGRLSAELLRAAGSGDDATGHRGDASRRNGDTTGRRVVAADYSAYATERAAARHDDLETAHLNLLRVQSLGLPQRLGFDGPFDLVANHVLDAVDRHARRNLLRLARMALRSGGGAYAACFGTGDPDDATPVGRGIDPDRLAEEARELGLSAVVTPLAATPGASGRDPFGIQFLAFATEEDR